MKVKDERVWLDKKVDAVYRYWLWNSSFGHKKNIYLAEFPKSGGTWLAQMLSELLELPFPRNDSIDIQPVILHGHHKIQSNKKNIIHILRDGKGCNDIGLLLFSNQSFDSSATIFLGLENDEL